MSAASNRPVSFCNFNCICTKSECNFKHNIESLSERRFAASVYGKIENIKENIHEDNQEIRKANCRFGQLCEREDCGYRHFLNYEGRKKFIAALKSKKTAPTKSVAKPPTSSAPAAKSSESEIETLKSTVTTLQDKVVSLEDQVARLNAIIVRLQNPDILSSAVTEKQSWADECA